MDKFLLIFVAGGIGCYSRFVLSGWLLQKLGAGFPVGTMGVNVIGCLLIGLIAGFPFESVSMSTRLALMIGFLGGLTTFSTFAFESLMLVTEGFPGRALINLLLTNLLCGLAVVAGFLITRWSMQLLKGG